MKSIPRHLIEVPRIKNRIKSIMIVDLPLQPVKVENYDFLPSFFLYNYFLNIIIFLFVIKQFSHNKLQVLF